VIHSKDSHVNNSNNSTFRVYRFENHPKPILAFSTIGLFFTGMCYVRSLGFSTSNLSHNCDPKQIIFTLRTLNFEANLDVLIVFNNIHILTAFSVVVYNFILYEIFSYFGSEHFFVCHTVNSTSEKGNRVSTFTFFFHFNTFAFTANTFMIQLTLFTQKLIN
jgi:hypothetical protein